MSVNIHISVMILFFHHLFLKENIILLFYSYDVKVTLIEIDFKYFFPIIILPLNKFET